MKSSSRLANTALAALPWALVVALTALNVLYMGRLGPNDDAYITFRVARNLAAGHGPVFNPGEQVLSVTTPGYMLLLAAASVISQDFVWLGLVLNGLALLLVGALVIDLSHISPPGPGTGRTRLLSVLAATLAVSLTLTFPLLTAAVGMETPLFMAAILASFAAYRRALRPSNEDRLATRWLLWTAAAAALAFLLRPDGLLVAVAIGSHWIVTRRRMVWRPVALFLALSLPWLVFAWLTYGSPMPNTLVAKATQALGENVTRWGPGLVQAFGDWTQQFPVAAFLALIGLLLALVRRQSGRSPLLVWTALTIVAHSALGVRSYFWYYVPFVAVMALLAGDGAAAIALWLTDRLDQRRFAGLATGLLALALAFAVLVPAAKAASLLTQPPIPRRREQAYLASAEFLRKLCASRTDATRVGVAEIGLIGYVSDCSIVDFAGLLQRDVAHLRVSPADKMAWTIKRYQPEYLVLSGGTNYPTQLSDSAWFRQRYEPADKIEQDGFRSVVYQRGLGPEMEHDLPDAAWWRTQEPDRTIDPLLYFAPGSSPAITLHAFLPPESSLAVNANGQPVVTLTGGQLGWQDVRLPTFASADGPVQLSLDGSTGDQPAAVAWIESNALPAVHYFVPLEDASTRPRPTIQLDPGASRTAQLARLSEDPVALELLYRDRPGVRLAVIVNGEVRGVVGGTDSWRVDQVTVPDAPVYDVELRNQGDAFVRVSHVALVRPFGAATIKE